jgi:hypothetical protein
MNKRYPPLPSEQKFYTTPLVPYHGSRSYVDPGWMYSISKINGVTIKGFDIENSVYKKCFLKEKIGDFPMAIPCEIRGMPVTSIGKCAFQGTDIKCIYIPNSVTAIGVGAFADCFELLSINIPDSVKSIGGDAFYNCRNLTSIVIPKSVEKLGNDAFGFCGSVDTLFVLPRRFMADEEKIFGWRDTLSFHYISD